MVTSYPCSDSVEEHSIGDHELVAAQLVESCPIHRENTQSHRLGHEGPVTRAVLLIVGGVHLLLSLQVQKAAGFGFH